MYHGTVLTIVRYVIAICLLRARSHNASFAKKFRSEHVLNHCRNRSSSHLAFQKAPRSCTAPSRGRISKAAQSKNTRLLSLPFPISRLLTHTHPVSSVFVLNTLSPFHQTPFAPQRPQATTRGKNGWRSPSRSERIRRDGGSPRLERSMTRSIGGLRKNVGISGSYGSEQGSMMCQSIIMLVLCCKGY